MPSRSLTVVISQGQSRSPDKRQLEQDVAAQAAQVSGARVLKIPHLYDLSRESQTYQVLRGLEGDLIVVSWLYDRAAHWVLDRHGVCGKPGEVLLRQADEDEDQQEEALEDADSIERVIDSQPRPDRTIFCIDFRASDKAAEFGAEFVRIHEARPADATADVPLNVAPLLPPSIEETPSLMQLLGSGPQASIDEHPTRRWYPVIDFSRCTNCMECIDFCLFGVYGVDSQETIVVEQPDNCRKGCPACSRVCPQNAIIFPQHKTPAIAGAPMDASGFKIDLSKLFGAPDQGEDALAVAAKERDEQLLLAGRQAVGLTEGIAARKSSPQSSGGQQDKLDDLINQLDALDL